MKKVIFFDGDGTLWYPAKTKRTVRPHWVYHDPSINNPWAEFVITPTARETLTELGEMGVKRVLLSTSPQSEEDAIISRIKAARQVDVYHLLDDVQVAPEYVEGKGERIVALLSKYGFKTGDALMVGDTYKWDYESAANVGVEGLLIMSDYQQEYIEKLDKSRVITNLIEVINVID
jgi:FMN phosphatase YigB (HAD superfamily)